MDDSEKWLRECEGKHFASVVVDLTSKITHLLEHKKSRGDKVSGPLTLAIRKALEYIQKEGFRLSSENDVLKARLADRAEFNNMMTELAHKISRTSTSSVEEPREVKGIVQTRKKEDFSIVAVPRTAEQSADEIKRAMKDICVNM